MKDSEIIQMYSVYLEEWKYRDNTFWDTLFKMIYASIMINAAPFLYKTFYKELVPLIIFPILAAIMQLVFLYVLISMHKRYIAIGNTLKKINDMLKKKYRREIVKGIFGKRMLYFVIYTTFIAMLALSISTIILLYVG